MSSRRAEASIVNLFLICATLSLSTVAHAHHRYHSTSTGTLALSAATYVVAQNAGSALITVNRTGGSAGAAVVYYATANQTAAAGTDYSSAQGSLQWAAGDSTPKSINIPVSDATPFKGTKALAVAIAQPTGAVLGSQTSAIVTIDGNAAAQPTVAIAATPTTVSPGASSTLTWSTSNASTCTASGGWSGATATSGSASMNSIAATTTYMLSCSGTGGTTSQAATVTVSSTPPSVTISASPTSVASGATSVLTWSSTNATACTASGGWSGTVAAAGSQATAAITTSTTYTLSCTGSGGSTSQSATVSVASSVASSGQVSRPSYNTGPGFFVLNGKLYDANGNEFRIRGVDRAHYDSISQPGLSKTGANAVRIMVETNYGASVAKLVSVVQNDHINYKEVPIVMTTETPAGANTSCSSDASVVAAAVANWVATASSWTPLDKYTIINIANEWGPTNSTVWRDSNISAIAKMRAAGYMGTLLIDAGGCGQDMDDLVNYSGAVFNSDPQKNVMFALHAYYNTTPANVASRFQQLASLAASTGAAYAVTEFGPGRNIGPSPTLLTPGEVITNAEANGLGWCAWAWDDNDLGNGGSDNNWFSMTLKGPGTYTQASDLTIFGTDVVLNATYGLSVLAKPASIFD